MNSCSYSPCERPRDQRGATLCTMHASRKRRGQPFDAPVRGYLPPETLELIAELVADGASLNEITRTTGVSRKKIKRMHPEYTGWGQGYSERSNEASKIVRQINKLGAHL